MEKYLFARICDGFAVKPLSKKRDEIYANFIAQATSKINPFDNLQSLYLHFGPRAKSNVEHSLAASFCHERSRQTADSVAVTDGLTLKGYHILKIERKVPSKRNDTAACGTK